LVGNDFAVGLGAEWPHGMAAERKVGEEKESQHDK
jgi:hypothetical protein